MLTGGVLRAVTLAVCAMLVVPLGGGPAGATSDVETVTLVVAAPPDRAQAAVQHLEQRVDVHDAVTLPAGDITTVEVAPARAAAALAALNADPRVEHAERDAPVFAAATPADPMYGQQWGITHTGVDAVWDTTMGAPGTVIAVIDTGVDQGHGEFAGASFTAGYNFLATDPARAQDTTDDNGHGTSAAGVIAAQHNSVGIAGVCPRCTIMPLKVLDANGRGSSSNVAAAVTHAVDNGADIINLSLAGTGYNQTLAGKVADAAAAGVLVVAAAGNANSDTVHYPAGYPGALGVAMSNDDDRRRTGSNYGDWVPLTGPACTPAPVLGGAMIPSYCGTSSAAAFVAGLAGSLSSRRTTRSGLTSALVSTAVAVPGGYVSGGRVAATPALAALNATPEVRLTTGGGWVRGTTTLAASADDDYGIDRVDFLLDGRVVGTRTVAPYEITLDTTTLPDGNASLIARATDTSRLNASAPAVTLRVDNTAPAVAVTAPAEGQTVSGTTTMSADVRDAAPASATFSVDGKVVGTDTTAPYQVSVDTSTMPPGQRTLTVSAVDAAGNAAQATRSFIVAPSAGGGGGGGLPPAPSPSPTASPSPSPSEDDDSADGTDEPCADAPPAEFRDVRDDNAHAPAIDCVVHLRIAGGRTTTTYDPAGTVTRAQMATFVANAVVAAGGSLPRGDDAYRDDDDSVHEAAINRLAAAGIVQGVGAGRYAPLATVTREQLATFLARGYAHVAQRPLPQAAGDAFDDDDGSAHESNINDASAAGLTNGVAPRRFAPTMAVRRDQMASFVVRLLEVLARS